MTGVSLNGTHSVLTFPEEVVLLLLDDEEGVPLLDRVLERIADNESPRYFAVDGKARHETGTRFSKLNNLPMDLMREEIHTGVLIAVDVVPPLYFIPAGYGDMRMFRDIVARLDDDRPIYGLVLDFLESRGLV